ncbi:MAG: homoserine O-succinyltransferase [Eubacterium sp.]|nr:homoserine O-succinyltransferase [Eubacterium sp.]
MPIKVPNDLPAVDTLTKENVFVMTDTRAMTQDIRPLKILILNLMPTKIATETQLTRCLSNSPLQVELELMQTSTHKAHFTSEEHMIAFYKTFDQIKDNNYDGMIVTGAPIELMEFEEVDYWEELCEIFDWAKVHVHCLFCLCWGAQAAMYHYYGIPKIILPQKLSGVYKHRLEYKTGMLFRGFDDEFYVPHSRQADTRREDIEAVGCLKILASSEEAGVFAVKSDNDREFYILGHSEYDADTLLNEYIRDKNAGLDIQPPINYFPNDDDTKEPIVRWRSSGNLLYTNWLNYFVYQSTPYDIRMISEEDLAPVAPAKTELTVSKFGGNCIANSERFRMTLDVIKSDPARKYIVVSAIGRDGAFSHVTDLLYGSTGSQKKFVDSMGIVEKRMTKIASDLGIVCDIHGEIEQIIKDYRSGVYGGNYVVSRGEYLAARLMAAATGYDFVDARNIIIFGYDGKIDWDKTRERVTAELAKHDRAVIPGFYGAFENGVVTVFPRGGSDITGAIVAEAVRADLYENWTDVPGVLMADPRIVEGALTVPIITYSELREMARMGAEVLHEDTVLPVKRLGIPINIRYLDEPDDPGTLIVQSAGHYKNVLEISGISGRSGYADITVDKAGINRDMRFRSGLTDLLVENHISIHGELTGSDAIDIVVTEDQIAQREVKIKNDIEALTDGATVRIMTGLALIAIVGRDLASSGQVIVKVFEAMSRERINVVFIDHSPKSISMTIGVAEADRERAIRAIYSEFTRLSRV